MKILLSHITDTKALFEFIGSKNDFQMNEVRDNVSVDVYAYRSGSNYTLSGNIKTQLTLICDRCLKDYKMPVEENFEIVFTVFDEADNDRIFALSSQADHINLMPYVRDTLGLTIPMQKICRTECKGICAHCGADLNIEGCRCSEKPTDPRWDKLKELKNKIEKPEE